MLCVDEKRQVQVLDLTQPGLPIKLRHRDQQHRSHLDERRDSLESNRTPLHRSVSPRLRILGELEFLDAVRLEVMTLHHRIDRRFADTQRGGQRAAAPLGHAFGLALQRGIDDFLDLVRSIDPFIRQRFNSMTCSAIEVLSVPLLGFHFFFSFERSYLRAPKRPHPGETWSLTISRHENHLMCSVSLCRMILRGLE